MKSWGLAVLIGVAAAALAAAVLLLVLSAAKENRDEQCRFHLMRMWNALGAAENPSSREWDGQPTGRAFWDRAAVWPGGKIPLDRRELVCPLLDRTEAGPGVEHIDYRGPARSLRELRADDPVAADRAGNHPTRGNVLMRSGAILAADDAAWARAAQTTSD